MSGQSEHDGDRIEELYNRMEGGYMYDGDGDWSQITDVVKVGRAIEFRTEKVGYDSVPHDIRENAYDSYDGEKVIVGCDVDDLVEGDVNEF